MYIYLDVCIYIYIDVCIYVCIDVYIYILYINKLKSRSQGVGRSWPFSFFLTYNFFLFPPDGDSR